MVRNSIVSTIRLTDLKDENTGKVSEMGKGMRGVIDLKHRETSEVVDLTGQVHQLPCTIKYNGSGSVSLYFKPKPTGTEVEGLNVQEAYFRGRKLHGTTLSLPQGYSGFVIGKKASDNCEPASVSGENSCLWETNATFQNVTYWNHESLPSQNDAFFRSFHWLTVAKALHNPVTAEDLASSSMCSQECKELTDEASRNLNTSL